MNMLVFVLVASWLFVSISATCAMPSAWMAIADSIEDCPQTGTHTADHHQQQRSKNLQDCSLKPCFEAQSNPSLSSLNRLVKPDLPLFVLCFVWTLEQLFFARRPPFKVRLSDPPPGRRIPLIYRFCTLLN